MARYRRAKPISSLSLHRVSNSCLSRQRCVQVDEQGRDSRRLKVLTKSAAEPRFDRLMQILDNRPKVARNPYSRHFSAQNVARMGVSRHFSSVGDRRCRRNVADVGTKRACGSRGQGRTSDRRGVGAGGAALSFRPRFWIDSDRVRRVAVRWGLARVDPRRQGRRRSISGGEDALESAGGWRRGESIGVGPVRWRLAWT